MRKYSFLLIFLFKFFALQAQIIPSQDNKPLSKKIYLAISTIFRDEAPYLKEWIEFHRMMGVEHFYLYNNLSSDEYLTVLQPYIDKGIVELFDVPVETKHIKDFGKTFYALQSRCYNHAINRCKQHAHWLAIIDSDEFILPVKEKDIPSVLKEYVKYPGLAVYWQIYGTSNVSEIASNELMVEKLLYKFPENHPDNWQFKTIVQPKYAHSIGPHECTYTKGKARSTDGKSRTFDLHLKLKTLKTPPIDEIRINHYRYRTESFYIKHKKARHERWKISSDVEERELAKLQLANKVFDPLMQKFIPRLRKRVYD